MILDVCEFSFKNQEMDQRSFSAIVRFLPYVQPHPDEIAFLESLPGKDQVYSAGESIGSERHGSKIRLLLSGWAVGVLVMQDGDHRIHTVHLPGDMLQMADLVLAEPDGWAEALTDVLVREFDGANLWQFFVKQPRLAAALLLIAQEERALRTEWFSLGISVGAKRRLAAFLYRIGERIKKYPDFIPGVETVPLSQSQVASLIGVTPVYVSRIVGQLCREGLIECTGTGIVLLDVEGLRRIAGIQPWNVGAPRWLPPHPPV